MRVRTLYDQGEAPYMEDGMVLCSPYLFGVMDGVSSSYTPAKGPATYGEGELTGGQMVISFITQACFSYRIREPLACLLLQASFLVKKWALANSLPIQSAEALPGATVAFARIRPPYVTVATLHDSFAIWQMKDGAKGASSNLGFLSEKEKQDKFAELMRTHGDRQKSWEEFLPYQALSYQTYRNKPNGYGVLNGQEEFYPHLQWFTFPSERIGLLILVTDGFVPYEATADPAALAQKVLKEYHRGGLPEVLRATREAQKARSDISWVTYPEATAIAIEF